MKISLGADHGGFALREAINKALRQEGHTLIDHGTFSEDSVDYPDYARLVGEDIVSGKSEFGVLICKSGIGMSIGANKMRGIRAALVHCEEDAALSRSHNNANILVLSANHIPAEKAALLARTFLHTPFEGGRHQRRVDKLENPGGEPSPGTEPNCG